MTDASPARATSSEAIAQSKAETARIEAAGSTAAGGTGFPAPGPPPGIAATGARPPGGGLATRAVPVRGVH